MQLERLQRVLIWLLITAASVFLLERVLLLFTQLATTLLLFGMECLMTQA
jgi:hypothetical protein